MLTKIGELISPLLSKDAVKPTDQKNHRENRRDDGEMEENQEDVTFFSIDAIRALMEQENIDLGDEARAYLDLLQRHGVVSIPIRNEQPIVEAITAAAIRLRGR